MPEITIDSSSRSAYSGVERRLHTPIWLAFPRLGILCSITGALLAIVMVPSDPSPQGSLFLCGSVFSVLLLSPLLVAFLLAKRSIFHAVNVLAAAPVFWLLLDLVQSAYPLAGVSQESVRTAFLCIGLFSAGIWGGAMMSPWHLPNSARWTVAKELGPRHLFILATVAFALSFCRFAVPSNFDFMAMVRAFDDSRWAKPWARGHFGGWSAFIDHFSYFGYALPTLVALLARKCGWLNWRTLIVLLYVFIIGALLSVGGGRRIIGVLIGSGTLVYFLSGKRFSMRSYVGFVLVILALGAVLQVMILYRDVGIAKAFSGDLQERWQSKSHFHVDDNFLRLTQIVEIFPDDHRHTTWRYPYYILVRPVPRAIWPGKPIDPGFNLAQYLGRDDVSFSSSVIGELYVSAGWIGCLLGGLLYGRIAMSLVSMFEVLSTNSALITYGLGVLAIFAGVRSAVDLVLMSYGALGWIAVVYIYDRFCERLSLGVQQSGYHS